MNRHTHWISKPWMASVLALVGGLAATSGQAQGVTGDANLDNLLPGSTTYYAQWADPSTTTSVGASGLTINSAASYGSLYYSVPTLQLQTLDVSDAQATLTLTVNSPGNPSLSSSQYWLGIPFVLNDNTGAVTYGGYAGEFGYYAQYSPATIVWNGDTVSETVPLSATQLAAVQAGGDQIYGFNVELDPAVMPAGPPFYSVTFDSLTVTPLPEPSTFALIIPGTAAILGFCRRQK